MAGHSKWANIKHRKAAQDAKRGKLFTKFIRELTVAAREGGSDPDSNPRLRVAIDKALGGNMTRDTVERAIKRGAGELEGQQLETILYEGYGPGGTAVMVETMTDNRNRTVSGVRNAFSKSGGNLGTDGSVSYLFTKRGVLSYAPGTDEDALMEAALEAGAEDIVSYDDGAVDVFTDPVDFYTVKEQLDKAHFVADNAEIAMIASTKAELDLETAEKFMRLIDTLEDHDDVQEVYHNAEISDDVMASLG
ncbi:MULTISPECIES: YebC/PmpR family DNA-binding transcriptional regulator [Shewanella]|uniref:YebC/PmpR family DNA-binding transcriptional regulator n=1 Tax=Shewanella TaxID=22 RepID=UPI0018E3D15A|nr:MULTISPECIES: YebC/PmpR family DNA-binding transcriptional regulator [Shewanella]MBI1675489.1 YebC/PmpR family DNA-binding transcriptional regulator [Shewanella sp. DW31]MBW3530844.1 YebC/PmpR family DNA-binding transcriptional regulator [Shewanella sp. NKUCC06_TVS]MCU8021485.1 YebC/PmpR family DNA-binding transcriptional regulator [Shewanella sp. SM78]MCU8041771.1 YebC/PmpR family DNA-binding transcriptional regulator [Shewanella sp. SM68]MCU8046634.1 YebC/PmpR family DNA-binding transcrip